jgi:hypothetical protein
MHRHRHVSALVIVLAMLAAIPLRAPRGCIECPPGCPMHSRGGDQRLGCHRRGAAPPGERCLRSACGHDSARADGAPEAIVRPPARVATTVRTAALAAVEPVADSRPDPEPPTEPPRAVGI